MSFLILNIGAKHTGKTTSAIKLAQSFKLREIVVNNKQREEKYRLASNKIRNFYGSKDQYISEVLKYNVKGSCRVFIVEEATVYLPHSGSNTLFVDSLLSARFNGNVYICNFHSLRQVPDYVLDYVDYFFIGKSRGRYDNLVKKYGDYPEVLKAFTNANKSTNQYIRLAVSL